MTILSILSVFVRACPCLVPVVPCWSVPVRVGPCPSSTLIEPATEPISQDLLPELHLGTTLKQPSCILSRFQISFGWLLKEEGTALNHFQPDLCPLCGGVKKPGTCTFTAELGFGVVVIRQVPATVCALCGADWIDEKTAARIEAAVEDARSKHSQIEVLAFS